MKQSHTIPERAIEQEREDLLERKKFVDRLTNALINSDTKVSTGITVGITGPWGSGKSSVLNMLEHNIRHEYHEALIVRFDPWLVSGRNDLIEQFFRELLGTISASHTHIERTKKLAKQIANYGAILAPGSDLIIPGTSTAITVVSNFFGKICNTPNSLDVIRKNIIECLHNMDLPIIVLIDELDRVEDEEVRSVAQLVKSIADFPNISYVLAYDSQRVIEALGSSASPEDRHSRGSGYLEKIVQLQIPLPVTFPEEIRSFIINELQKLAPDLELPDDLEKNKRFEELLEIAPAYSITNLRDLNRLIGSFKILRNMVRHEVDWVDLLGYCCLLTRAPLTVERIRNEPDDFLENPITQRTNERRKNWEGSELEYFESIIPAVEKSEPTIKILNFLFPHFGASSDYTPTYPDALSQRAALLTTVRLGLLPGSYSRSKTIQILGLPSQKVAEFIRLSDREDKLASFLNRLTELYSGLAKDKFDQIKFWFGVDQFSQKTDCEWMTSYNPMNQKVRSFMDFLISVLERNSNLSTDAGLIYEHLAKNPNSELTAFFVHYHIHRHGLFNSGTGRPGATFLNSEDTLKEATRLSKIWKAQHLEGKLVPCRWDLQPVFTMIDTGVWDEECRILIERAVEDESALDGLSLMLFGSYFSTERSTVDKICSIELFNKRIESRLHDKNYELDQTVRSAMEKALNPLF